jgi:hypothetical protein
MDNEIHQRFLHVRAILEKDLRGGEVGETGDEQTGRGRKKMS